MGAEEFDTVVLGEDDLQAAFAAARHRAEYDYGHAGYTGTIAEKDSVVVIQNEAVPIDQAWAIAAPLLDNDDPRIADKWGPAGAIRIVA